MEYTTPPSYGSTVVNVGGIAKDGEIICGGATNSVQHTQIKNDPENEWPEPGAVKFLWSGMTKDDKTVNAKLEGKLGQRLDKIDVLAKVPGLIKTLVGGVVGTKPFIYQVSRPSSDGRTSLFAFAQLIPLQYAPKQKLELQLKIDNEESIEEGTLFSEATFIS